MSLFPFNLLEIYREAGIDQDQKNISEAPAIYQPSTKAVMGEQASAKYLWNSLVSHFPANMTFAYVPQMRMDNSEE